jgi:hypothetical protein
MRRAARWRTAFSAPCDGSTKKRRRWSLPQQGDQADRVALAARAGLAGQVALEDPVEDRGLDPRGCRIDVGY